MSIANLTTQEVMAQLAKHINLSSVPLTESELADEIRDCQKAGYSLRDTAELLLGLVEDDSAGRESWGGIHEYC